MDDSIRRHGVVAVIIRRQEFLVIRRSEFVAAPGAYCFPGGGIESGESEEAALRRELLEELNLTVEPRRRLWQSVTPWQVALSWWLAEMPEIGEPQPAPNEVHSAHWMRLEQLRGLDNLLASNHEFLAAWARGEFSLPIAPDP